MAPGSTPTCPISTWSRTATASRPAPRARSASAWRSSAGSPAPLAVYTSFDDLRFRFQLGGETLTAAFRSDDDFAFGVQIGADVPFGDGRWSLNLTTRYLDVGLSVVDEDGVHTVLQFDPLVLSAGFGVRF